MYNTDATVLRRRSSMAEQGTHKPLVGRSNRPVATNGAARLMPGRLYFRSGDFSRSSCANND